MSNRTLGAAALGFSISLSLGLWLTGQTQPIDKPMVLNSTNVDESLLTAPTPPCIDAATATNTIKVVGATPIFSVASDDNAIYDDSETTQYEVTEPTYQLANVLKYGLTQEEADDFLMIPDFTFHVRLQDQRHLIGDVVQEVTLLDKDTITRQYLIAMLKDLPDADRNRVANQLLAMPRAQDQTTAIALITTIEDEQLRINTTTQALKQSLSITTYLNLLQTISNDPALIQSRRLSQQLEQEYHSTASAMIKLNILTAGPISPEFTASVYNDISQFIRSDDLAVSMKAMNVVKAWIRQGNSNLNQQQLAALKFDITAIANNTAKPTVQRIESLDLLQLFG